MIIICWNCQKEIVDRNQKIGFRESCPFCSSDLHVCVNCKFFSPGKPNSCSIPETDWVSDKQKSNLCEDFELKSKTGEKTSPNTEQIFGKNCIPKPKKFDELF